MAKQTVQTEMTLSREQARRLALIQQGLWPPRSLEGGAGALAFIRRVGCIQFDPINITVRNADLVLQSRVANYTPDILENLLYQERQLWDGLDKVASIYPVEDWPYFARRREAMEKVFQIEREEVMQAAPFILEQIEQRGALSSLELETTGSIRWDWGNFVRVERACLEALFARGDIGIHHRVAARRYFDLAHRLVPPEIYATPDPNPNLAAYQDWHVHRRVGGIGLAHAGASEFWLGIRDTKSSERKSALARLTAQGKLLPIAIEGVTGQVFYIRAAELPTLEQAGQAAPPPRAAFIAPLDNLMWDRDLVRMVFGFDYTWEVYKPAHKRQYGYYVLPVLYGDRFIARCEMALERKTQTLHVKGWWWETGVNPDAEMRAALQDAFAAFRHTTGAAEIAYAPGLEQQIFS